MSTYVIDSSIAVKWAFKEKYSYEASLYTNKSMVRIAPNLLLLECISAIQKKVWTKEIDESSGWEAYKLIFEDNSFTLFESERLLESTYRLAVELSHAVYDCHYLALALQQSARLVTADQKFYSRVQTSPYSNIISWVEDPPILK